MACPMALLAQDVAVSGHRCGLACVDLVFASASSCVVLKLAQRAHRHKKTHRLIRQWGK